jgi:nucleotide-binding universal stress UspA family protein
MKAIHTIVAATDFSPAADRAVLRAVFIAKQLGAELTLLHVVPPLALYPGMRIGPDAETWAAAGEHAAAGRLEAQAQILREHYAVRVHTAQRIGRAYRQIADHAAAMDAGLVVVGARGENSLARLLLGSTAWRLLRVRRGPVLVVRNAPFEAYHRPLAAVDFSPDSRAALAWAARLTADGRLDVLHVLPREDEEGLRGAGLDSQAIQQRKAEMHAIADNLMANLLADLPVRASGQVETGSAPKVILERAAERRAGLIVLGRHGIGGLEEWLLGSVSKDVAQAADCDVLLVGADGTA